MTFLVNRNASSRIECLHALAKHIDADPRLTNGFRTTSDVKVQNTGHRITHVCTLLVADKALGRSYCPYKSNPLDKGVCQLTNSVEEDSTKSKESSNSVNSLEALGFLGKSRDGLFKLTTSGRQFSAAAVESSSFTQLVRRGVLNYGPAFGLLAQLANNEKLLTAPHRAVTGYPQTDERVTVSGKQIILPVGSQEDSNNRTRTTLLRWLVAAGCLVPRGIQGSSEEPAVAYRSFLNSPKRAERKFDLTDIGRLAVKNCPNIAAPLDYVNTLKNLSLRERGQKAQREALLQVANIVRNRRTAIALILNRTARAKSSISVSEVRAELLSNVELFAIHGSIDQSVVASEMNVAFSVGLPFLYLKNGKMIPLSTINQDVLLSTAIDQMKTYAENS